MSEVAQANGLKIVGGPRAAAGFADRIRNARRRAHSRRDLQCQKFSTHQRPPRGFFKVAMEPNLLGPPLLGGSGRAWAFKFRFFSTACIWTCTGIPLIAASVGFQDWPTGETQAFYCG